MGKAERSTEMGFFARHKVLTGLVLVGAMEAARRVYQAAPLTIIVDSEGVRKIVLTDGIRYEMQRALQGIYAPPQTDDRHVMRHGTTLDIDSGRVRQSSESDSTKAAKSEKTESADVLDAIDEALTDSASLFGPRGLKGYMEDTS